MTYADTTKTTLAFLEGFLSVDLWKDGASYSTLEVYSSVMVQSTDECLLPVYDYLNQECFRDCDWETIEDDSMIRGEAWLTTYRIHHTCPGDEFPHNCKFDKLDALPRK